MRTGLRVALLALAVAFATAVLGWWVVPLLGAVWGTIASPGTRPGFTMSAAAGIGWVLLLLWTAAPGPLWEVARKVGGVMSVPGWALIVVTVGFPMVLAGSAAVLAGTFRRGLGKQEVI